MVIESDQPEVVAIRVNQSIIYLLQLLMARQ